MKFELKQSNRGVADEDFIEDLRHVAAEARLGRMTHRQYRSNGGRFGDRSFRTRFGSWAAACDLAGLEVTVNRNLSDEDLFDDLAQLWNRLGHQPSYDDFTRKQSRFSVRPYADRFGGLTKALEAFVARQEGWPIGNHLPVASVGRSTPRPRAQSRVTKSPKTLSGPPEGLPNLAEFSEASQVGATEMAKYYSRLYSLERQMRTIVVETLEQECGAAWWSECVPAGIQEGARQILVAEEKTGVTPRSQRLIDYTTLGELGVIVTSNWKHFAARFKNEQAMARVMRDLNLLRVFVMHCTPLPPDEVVRLNLTINDWLRQLKA